MKLQVFVTILAYFCTFSLGFSNEALLKEAKKGSNNIIELTTRNYKRILEGPRDSFILVFLTASAPQIGCSICMEAGEEYNMVVSSWFKDHPDGLSTKGAEPKGLFFAKADIKDPQNIPEIFQFYSLQHVPRFLLFSPGGDINTYDVIDLMGNPGIERASNIVNSLKGATKITDFKIYKPIDWSFAMIGAVATFVTVYLFKRHSTVMINLLTMKPLWATLWTSFIILMLGGYMYNTIRNAQLAGVGEGGEIMYFMPNQTQNQFKIETQVVGVLYTALAASVLGLIIGIPKLRTYFKGKGHMYEAILSILLTTVVYALFAGLTAIFNIKHPGYPFQLIKLSSLFK